MTEQSEKKTQPIRCKNCGHDNLPTATICLVCDAPLTYTSRFKGEHPLRAGLLPPSEEELFQAQSQEEQELIEAAKQRFLAQSKEGETTQESSIVPMEELSARKSKAKCPDCGYENRIGDLFCLDCGVSIVPVPEDDSAADSTQKMKMLTRSDIQARIDAKEQNESLSASPSLSLNVDRPELKSIDEDVIPDGCFQFMDGMRLRFTDIETGGVIETAPNKDKPMLVGRSHQSLPVQPDVDLTPFLMEQQHGVSRRHALMRLRDLRLEMQDLNSTNGTGINGFRFQPKETHQIRNGDIVTLGRVSIKITFLSKDEPKPDYITERLDF
jgi:hypothetical protein